MQIQINGETRTVASVSSLAALIQSLGMKADRVAVELNLEIVPRARWSETPIKDGDRLEIVHFVGGGSLGFSANILRPKLPFQFSVFIFGCVFALTLLLQAKPEIQEFLAVDACLDAGGSYDYKNQVCDDKESHPYAPRSSRFFSARRLGASTALGIVSLLVVHVGSRRLYPQKPVGAFKLPS